MPPIEVFRENEPFLRGTCWLKGSYGGAVAGAGKLNVARWAIWEGGTGLAEHA